MLTFTFGLRLVLELLVMGGIVAITIKLRDDWKVIHPPEWRSIILAMLVTVFANGLGILYAMTMHSKITWVTWCLVAAFTVQAAILLHTRTHHYLRENHGKRG